MISARSGSPEMSIFHTEVIDSNLEAWTGSRSWEGEACRGGGSGILEQALGGCRELMDSAARRLNRPPLAEAFWEVKEEGRHLLRE